MVSLISVELLILAHIFTCWCLPFSIVFNGAEVPFYAYVAEAIYFIDFLSRSVLVTVRTLSKNRSSADAKNNGTTSGDWEDGDEEKETAINYFRLKKAFDFELGPSCVSDFLAIVR